MRPSTEIAIALTTLFLALHVAPALAQEKPGPTPWREPPPIGGFPGKHKRDGSQQATPHAAAKKLIAQGNFAEAIPLLQQVVSDDPRNDDAWHDLGYASQKLGRYADAVGYYERALAIRPSRKDTRALLGETQLALNNLAAAEAERDQLKQICTQGCVELQTLETQIAAYRAAHPA